MTISEAHIQSGAMATEDIARAIARVYGECLMVHGNDPNQLAILTAGVARYIDLVNEHIDPNFKEAMRRMLEKGR